MITAPAALREALNVVRPAEQAPPGWRVLGSDTRSSTSRCIGDPRTPLCAIETFMACKYWAATDQCEKIWVQGVAPYDMLGSTVERGERSVSLGFIVQYRVVDVRTVPRDYDGTSLLVTTQERLYDPGTSYCEMDLPRLWNWQLGQEHGRWVVTWPGLLSFGSTPPNEPPVERPVPDSSPFDAPELDASPSAPPAPASSLSHPLEPGWSRLGTDRASSTSRCLGDPRTARCAVETHLACWLWGEPELCRLVTPDGVTPKLPTPGDGPIISPDDYRITVDHRFPLPYEARNPANLDLVARGATWTITSVERWIHQDGGLHGPDVAFWYLARQGDRWVIRYSAPLREP